MKKKYLATLALAGILVFAGVPMVVSASSPNAGGTIIDGNRGDAGDTMDVGEGEVPLDVDEGEVPQEDIGEGDVPLDAGEDNVSPEDIGEGDVPLAVMSDQAKNAGTSWVPYAVGAGAATAVVGAGIWMAFHTGAIKAGAVKAGANGWRLKPGAKKSKKK